MNQET